MTKTRKVQVTLDEAQYERLAEIARRQEKKLARVVRESIVRYCLEPEIERKKRAAIESLLAVEPTPVPEDYATWEAEYSERKVGAAGRGGAGDAPADDEGATGPAPADDESATGSAPADDEGATGPAPADDEGAAGAAPADDEGAARHAPASGGAHGRQV